MLIHTEKYIYRFYRNNMWGEENEIVCEFAIFGKSKVDCSGRELHQRMKHCKNVI